MQTDEQRGEKTVNVSQTDGTELCRPAHMLPVSCSVHVNMCLLINRGGTRGALGSDPLVIKTDVLPLSGLSDSRLQLGGLGSASGGILVDIKIKQGVP